MNRRSSLLCLTLALPLTYLVFSNHADAQVDSSRKVPNQFLVRWASQPVPQVLARGVAPARWQQQSLSAQLNSKVPGAGVTSTFSGSGWSLITVPAGSNAETTKARLVSLLGKGNVTYNYTRQVARTPNDLRYDEQWQWKKIKAEDAWGVSTGDPSVVVAVLDSGVDLTHPDLKPNLWKNTKEIPNNGKDDDNNGYVDDYDGYNGLAPGTPPQDDFGHGTHCAGLIGAVGDNKRLVVGVNWKVKILPLKFINSSGTGDDGDAIRCMEYAVKLKQSGVNLRVISNSWSSPPEDPALLDALKMVEKAGILSVCAAGNGDPGHNIDVVPEYPPSYTLDSMLVVGSSEADDSLAFTSNFGPKSVDLVAPGVSILSTYLGGDVLLDSGTSMATPIVAGAAALIAGREPGLTAKEIKARILSTVDPVESLKGFVNSKGRLNLYRALTNNVFSISGQVYQTVGTTTVPLVGVLIKVKGKTVTSTDKKGKYVINDVAPGSYALTAVLNGYSFNPATVTISAQTGNGVANFPALKAPSALYSISGYCMDASGKPVKGVAISIVGTPNPVTTSESNGKYTITSRGKGTYQLTASSGDKVLWKPSVNSVTVPTAAGTKGAPNGTIDFSGSLPDDTPPVVTISSPVNGAKLLPSAPVARGTATDATGLKQLNFKLTRLLPSGEFGYYDWTKKVWTTDDSSAGTTGIQPQSGSPKSWDWALPSLVVARYILTVSGVDALNNGSTGEADASVTFDVAASTAKTKAAVSPEPAVSNSKS